MDLSGLFELAKYVVPSIIIFVGTYFIMNSFFENEWQRKSFEKKTGEDVNRQSLVVPMKLQAYERLILFLERINPNSSLHRVRRPGMSCSDLQLALIRNIREEFEHNLAQQLYVTEGSWTMVKTVKEEMIKFYNILGSKMPQEATEMDFSRAIFDYLMTSEKDLPTETAIKFLKQDAAKLLV